MGSATLLHMSTTALYKALIEAGASENLAEKAVENLMFSDQVTTKSDLKTGLAELESRLTWRMVIVAGVTIGALGIIVKL